MTSTNRQIGYGRSAPAHQGRIPEARAGYPWLAALAVVVLFVVAVAWVFTPEPASLSTPGTVLERPTSNG